MITFVAWYFLIGLFVACIDVAVDHALRPWTQLSLTWLIVSWTLWPFIILAWFLRIFK